MKTNRKWKQNSHVSLKTEMFFCSRPVFVWIQVNDDEMKGGDEATEARVETLQGPERPAGGAGGAGDEGGVPVMEVFRRWRDARLQLVSSEAVWHWQAPPLQSAGGGRGQTAPPAASAS